MLMLNIVRPTADLILIDLNNYARTQFWHSYFSVNIIKAKMKLRLSTLLLLFNTITITSIYGQKQSIKTFSVNNHENLQRLENFIEHITILPLEETQESLISYFEFYLPTSNGFFIGSKGDKKIYFFNKQGEFQFHIESSLDFENSFSGFSNVWIREDILEFFSPTNRKVYRYSLGGDFIEALTVEVDKEIRLGNMLPYGNGYVVTTIENLSLENGAVEKSIAGHALIFLNERLEFQSFAHEDNTVPPFPIASAPRLYSDNGSLLYKETLNDSLFSIIESTLEPIMQINFGKDWAWTDPRNASTLGSAFAEIQRSERVYEFQPFFTPNYIFVKKYINADLNKLLMIERGSGDFVNFRRNVKEFGLRLVGTIDNDLIAFLTTLSLKEFLSKIDPKRISVIGDKSIAELLESENPVILKLRLSMD